MRARTTTALLAMLVLLTACGSAAVGFPNETKIVPPPPDLPPELAAYSGIWEGLWTDEGKFALPGAGLASRLGVEEIALDHATVVYGWAASPGYFEAGWSRLRTAVRPGGTLVFGETARFTLTMATDRASIAGVRTDGTTVSRITFRRVR